MKVEELKTKYRKVFLGEEFGVGLSQRGPKDLHVVFTILSDDDCNWMENEGSASSHWVFDLIKVLQVAEAWMKTNCDEDAHDNRTYGYTFRQSEN